MSLYAELKRRNVFRAAAAYLVLAWLLLQIGDVLFGALDLPAAWNRGLLALLLLGGIPVLVFSWVYELTPEGIKRESEISKGESVTAETAKKLDLVVIALLIIAIGIFATERLFFPRHAPAPSPETELVRGIAVLPFQNLSADPGNAFFAGGVHEDVLTHLSRIPELRVISRTSMLKIAETDLDVPAIAERLGVSHVLEGSVRRSDDRVRVTVQLIDGSNDEHLWAENYDRTLTDIFAIQSEIAIAIAAQLQTELSPETVETLMQAPTRNTVAYDLFVKARTAMFDDTAEDHEVTYERVIELASEAVELDADFLDAHVMLLYAHGRLVWEDLDPDGSHAQAARRILNDIVERWPERPETHMAGGHYLYTVDRNYTAAQRAYAQALLELPDNPRLLYQLAASLKRLGRYKEQELYLRRLIELDPEVVDPYTELTLSLEFQDRADQARALIERMRERFPDSRSVAWDWAYRVRLLQDGDRETLVALAAEDPFIDARSASLRGWWLAEAGDIDGARAMFEARRTNAPSSFALRDASMDLLLLQRDDEDAFNNASRVDDLFLLSVARDAEADAEGAWDWAYLTLIAAIGGDAELYTELRSRWAAVPQPDDPWTRYWSAFSIARADALMGDPKTAWASMEEWRRPGFLTPGYAAAWRAYLDHFFGDVAGYQAFVASFEPAA
ncbi:MAG: hypothetical protein QNJ00_15835 [Woeseiaceae bacterium]|nr:hypothetical protein [Woeseiaceae bacterium]